MAGKVEITDNPGSVVGPYTLATKLGEGELGVLLAARTDGGLGTLCTMRVLESSPEVAARLAEAARAAVGIEQEHLVAIQAVLESDGKVAIVSEYCEGETLSTLLRAASVRRTHMTASIALRVALDVLEGLRFAHEQEESLGELGDLRHGGLAPSSVVVGSDGTARLMDLAASGVAARSEPWTKDGKWIAYASPEAVKREASLGPEADVFTAGILLWEMLQNKRLFSGLTYTAVSSKVLEQKVGRVDVGRPETSGTVSEALATVVARALERDRHKRFGTATDMAAAIKQCGDRVAERADVAAWVDDLAGRTIAATRASLSQAIGRAKSNAPPPVDAIAPLPKGARSAATAPNKPPAAPNKPPAAPNKPPAAPTAGPPKPPPKKKPAGPPPAPGAGAARKEPPRKPGAAAPIPETPEPAPAEESRSDFEVDLESESDAPLDAAAADAASEPPGSEEPEPSTKRTTDESEGGTAAEGGRTDADPESEQNDEDEHDDEDVADGPDAKGSESNLRPAPSGQEAPTQPADDEPARTGGGSKGPATPAPKSTAAAAKGSTAVPAVEDEPPSKPNKTLWIALGVIGLVVVVVVVGKQLGGDGSSPDSSTSSSAPLNARSAERPAATSVPAATAEPNGTAEPPPTTTAQGPDAGPPNQMAPAAATPAAAPTAPGAAPGTAPGTAPGAAPTFVPPVTPPTSAPKPPPTKAPAPPPTKPPSSPPKYQPDDL